MAENEKIFDPYTVTFHMRRSWATDASIAGGQHPKMKSCEAIRLMLSEELDEAIKQEVLHGEVFGFIEIHPPQSDSDKTMFVVEELVQACREVLTSTGTRDKEVLDAAFQRLLNITSAHPDLVNKRIIMAGDKPIALSAEEWAEMQGYVASSQKIQAIKLFRQITSLGLKEAKDAIEDPKNGLFPLRGQL